MPTAGRYRKSGRIRRLDRPPGTGRVGTGGSTPRGSHPSLNPFGTYDMAGNLKEWAWNEIGGGHHEDILAWLDRYLGPVVPGAS